MRSCASRRTFEKGARVRISATSTLIPGKKKSAAPWTPQFASAIRGLKAASICSNERRSLVDASDIVIEHRGGGQRAKYLLNSWPPISLMPGNRFHSVARISWEGAKFRQSTTHMQTTRHPQLSSDGRAQRQSCSFNRSAPLTPPRSSIPSWPPALATFVHRAKRNRLIVKACPIAFTLIFSTVGANCLELQLPGAIHACRKAD